MTLNELKNWINSLPEEYNDHTVVNGKVGTLNEEYFYRVDSPITTLMVDQKNKEIVVMYDDQDDFKVKTNDAIDDFEKETDNIIEALQSEEFNASFRKQIEDDTWGQDKPMYYVDDEGWLVEHHKDGTINKLKQLKDNS